MLFFSFFFFIFFFFSFLLVSRSISLQPRHFVTFSFEWHVIKHRLGHSMTFSFEWLVTEYRTRHFGTISFEWHTTEYQMKYSITILFEWTLSGSNENFQFQNFQRKNHLEPKISHHQSLFSYHRAKINQTCIPKHPMYYQNQFI